MNPKIIVMVFWVFSGSLPAQAAWWVNVTNSATASHLGASRFGPFATRAEAQAQIDSSHVYGGFFSISGSDDVSAGSSGSSDPLVQAGSTLGTAIGNALVNGIKEGLAQRARIIQQGNEEKQIREGLEAARLAEEKNQDALRLQQGTANLQGVLKMSDDDDLDVRQQQIKAAQKHNGIGQTLMSKNDYQGALDEFQKALALTPDNSSIIANVALAKQKLLESQNVNTDSNIVDLRGLSTVVDPAKMKGIQGAVTGTNGMLPQDTPVSTNGHDQLSSVNSSDIENLKLLPDDMAGTAAWLGDKSSEWANKTVSAKIKDTLEPYLKNIPGYSVIGAAKGYYDQYGKYVKLIRPEALKDFGMAENFAMRSVEINASPSASDGGLNVEMDTAFEQRIRASQTNYMKGAASQFASGMGKQNAKDEKQAVTGKNPDNVVPLNTSQDKIGYHTFDKSLYPANLNEAGYPQH